MSFSKYFGNGAIGKAIDKYLNKNSSTTKPVQGTTPSKEKQLGNYSTPSTPSSSKPSSGGNKSYVNPSPAVNKPVSNQYQYANYDSNNKFLGYTTGESGRSNAMGSASYVVAPNGQKYNTGFTSSNQGNSNPSNNNSINFDGRVVNRSTRDNNISSLSGYNNILGWNDKSNDRLNLSYLPEGLTLPSDGNFSVASYGITGADGNTLLDKNGKPIFEYRPHVYYDRDGNASFTNKNDIVITKGGRTDINSEAYGLQNPYGYDQQEVRGQESQMVEMKHPVTGQWQKMNRGSAEAIWRNYTEGGYYSQADKANNFRVVPNEYAQSIDLANSFIHSDNRQAQIEMSNKMYQDSPESAVGFRLQRIDDYLRSEHFKKTGENVPINYFIQNGEALKQLNKIGTDKNVLDKVISEFNKIPLESQSNVSQPVSSNTSNTFNQNDYLLQAQEEYDAYMKEQSAKLAQQQAEYEALMKQYEVDKNEQANRNKYLESELNSYNGSNQDSTYKSTITEDARTNAISKYLRELEKANQKK